MVTLMKLKYLFVKSFSIFFILVLSQTLPADVFANDLHWIMEKFQKELDCTESSRDLQRHWCPVTRIENSQWVKPQAKVKNTYIGISIELTKDKPLKAQLLDTTNLAVLHLSEKEARVTSLTPSNPEEQKTLGGIVMQLAFLLKGKLSHDGVQVPQDLYTYLMGDQKKPGYIYQTEKNKTVFQGKLPSQMYFIEKSLSGPVYLVFEKAKGGYYVNLFPQKPMQLKK